MDKSKKEILELLARIYTLLAAIDLDFQVAEENKLREKLSEWAPDFNPEELDRIISSAISSFKSSDQLQIFNESSGTLNDYFDINNKINVLNDLIDIAASDGVIHENERKMIIALAEDWGLENEIDIDAFLSAGKTKLSPEETAGSVFHDILTLLIYTANESMNNISDTEWDSIYADIVTFNLIIDNRSFNIAKYKNEDISEIANLVIERMWGNGDNPRNPSSAYKESLKNINNYFEKGILDKDNLYMIIRFMYNSVAADGSITDNQKNILEEIIDTYIENIPALQKIKAMLKTQIAKQKPKETPEPEIKSSKGGNIKIAFEVKKPGKARKKKK